MANNGRLFTNYPMWSDKYKHALVEVMQGNKVKPYPNDAMNSWKPGMSGKDKWVCVQAVYIDDSNTMWIVDPAAPMLKTVYQQSYKLVKINLATDSIERVYTLKGIKSDTSYINDVRVDSSCMGKIEQVVFSKLFFYIFAAVYSIKKASSIYEAFLLIKKPV